MRAVVERVSKACVSVGGEPRGAIEVGLLVYLGVAAGDGDADVQYVVDKVSALRIFPDEAGKMNRSLIEAGGAVLVVPAFTVQADARKGRRPAFDAAADAEPARSLFTSVCEGLNDAGLTVARGVFGAHMAVDVVNDGPICILLDSRRTF